LPDKISRLQKQIADLKEQHSRMVAAISQQNSANNSINQTNPQQHVNMTPLLTPNKLNNNNTNTATTTTVMTTLPQLSAPSVAPAPTVTVPAVTSLSSSQPTTNTVNSTLAVELTSLTNKRALPPLNAAPQPQAITVNATANVSVNP
jgi:hypothetical protein